MTDSAEVHHIEASFYHTSVSSLVDFRKPLCGTAPSVIPIQRGNNATFCRARRRSHRSRSPPTHRRHDSPPPPSTPMQSTNLPPLPRLRRRHPTPAPTRRPDPRRSRSLSRRRPPRPRSPRPYRSPATFTTPRPIEHHPTHRPRQSEQRRPHLTHTSPDISSDTAPRRSWLHSRPTITLKPNPHTSHSITPSLPPPRCPAPPAQYTLHQPPPDTHINPPPPPSRPPHPATPRSSNPASTHLTLPSNYQRMDFPIDHMLTQHFPPNQLPPSDTPSPPLQLPEIRQSMSIPNYKQLQETLTTAQQRANWLAPHWQLYQNLSIQHPTTPRLYLQARKCSPTALRNTWPEPWPPRVFPSAPSNPSPTTPTRTRTFGE